MQHTPSPLHLLYSRYLTVWMHRVLPWIIVFRQQHGAILFLLRQNQWIFHRAIYRLHGAAPSVLFIWNTRIVVHLYMTSAPMWYTIPLEPLFRICLRAHYTISAPRQLIVWACMEQQVVRYLSTHLVRVLHYTLHPMMFIKSLFILQAVLMQRRILISPPTRRNTLYMQPKHTRH